MRVLEPKAYFMLSEMNGIWGQWRPLNAGISLEEDQLGVIFVHLAVQGVPGLHLSLEHKD